MILSHKSLKFDKNAFIKVTDTDEEKMYKIQLTQKSSISKRYILGDGKMEESMTAADGMGNIIYRKEDK